MSSDVEVSEELQPFRESGSFVADLDITSLLLSETRCLLHAPMSHAVATSTGAASLAMIVSLLDIAASEPALAACRPDWTVTQDLTVHATELDSSIRASTELVEGPVVVDAQLVRVGKKTITVAANVYDGHGVTDFDMLQRGIDRDGAASTGLGARSARTAGSPRVPTLTTKGLVTFARIPGSSAAGMDDYDPANWMGRVRRRTYSRPPVGTLSARMGLQIPDAAAGVLQLVSTRYVTNSIGTIFGGVQAALAQFAAEAMRPGMTATDLQVHYLSQLKVGPARTRGSVSRDAADHSVVTVQLVDAGNDDRLLAVATVLLLRPPR